MKRIKIMSLLALVLGSVAVVHLLLGEVDDSLVVAVLTVAAAILSLHEK